MTIPRRHVLQLIAATTLLTSPRMARADDYPSRPITVIVPFSAGGPLDITGRMIAAKMQQTLGQPLVIENVGSIGVGRGARAVPDGYTLTMGI
jgi:tripartite-type tricarboxylate transporter receptor subunit TctC